MQRVALTDAFFTGVVSVERGEGWLRPWRLPCQRLALFIAPGDSLVGRAREASGCRLRFETNATAVRLGFLPLPSEPVNPTHVLDLTIDGEIAATAEVPHGGTEAIFDRLPAANKVVEVWLPHDSGIDLQRLEVRDGATCQPAPDNRPKWTTYGSSLTHCRRAHGSARTWPAIVARRLALNLTSLGYGGNCCLEPMVGLMIRDLPADIITLKLGINCIGGALAPRTFPGAVMGLVQIIREKRPETPICLVSPIGYPPNETTPNVVGNTIEQMRIDIEEVHARLTARGDRNLHYVNGLKVFGEPELAEYTQDQCHPNGDGIELMAENFLSSVMARLPVPTGNSPKAPSPR